MIEQLQLFVEPSPSLLARLAAFGWTLTYDPREAHGYRSDWRLDGCGAPSWGTLVGIEDWLNHQEQAEQRKQAA